MKRVTAFILLFALIICSVGVMPAAAAPSKVQTDGEFRGVWVSSVYNLDYPSKPGLGVDELKREAAAILDGALDMGFNAVILQVRPTGDALYKSDIFPWSDYLTNKQGQAPASGFDPLKYWVDEAHARGLELHAWINPFRITRGSEASPKQNVTALAESNPARKNPAYAVKYKDGCLYYDPGIPEVRELVINGVKEIIRNYDVDGIHFDDYFYPGTDFSDSATYKKYGAAFSNIGDWRRDNVDKLIKGTYDAIKAIDSSVRFGVSPFGIWANKSENSFGSDTNGQQSYYAHYADSRKWVKAGWLDYICPQLYWNIGFKVADYEKLLKWWADVMSGTKVDLYIGQAAYRVTKDASAPWNDAGEIIRQLNMNKLYPEVKGVVHFRYKSFTDYKPLCDAVKTYFNSGNSSGSQIYDSRLLSMPSRASLTTEPLMVGRPAADTTTTLSKYYILGSSDPSKPLYMNGTLISDRSASGYFGVQVALSSGANTFTFTQAGKSVTRTIKRSSGSSSGSTKMSVAEIIKGSEYPSVYDEYKKPGETITLKCTAPVGADVTVRVGGTTYAMKPATSGKAGSTLYSTTYSYTYKIPSYSDTGKVITVGAPVYTMKLNGKTSTRTADGIIKCITPGAPYYAEVTSDTAFIYASNTTTGGPVGELAKGMKDYITAVTGNGAWVRLGMGYWIPLSDVKRTHEERALSAAMNSASYSVGSSWDVLKFDLSLKSAAYAKYDGKSFIVTVYNTKSAPDIKLPSGACLDTASAKLDAGKAIYTFTSKNGVEGYYTETSGQTLYVYIKRKPAPAAGSQALSGITIMLDAGHGGSDPGAIGPLGSLLPEKTIALSATLRLAGELEKRGARVLLTRTSDVYMSLQDRLEMNRTARPDLFLSLHINSMGEDVDSKSISGVSTWYKENVSKDIAALLYEHTYTELSRGKRGSHQSNLYVCRGTWCPSMIFEIGFISNPGEYEWMTDNAKQDEFIASLVRGVVKYFN